MWVGFVVVGLADADGYRDRSGSFLLSALLCRCSSVDVCEFILGVFLLGRFFGSWFLFFF